MDKTKVLVLDKSMDPEYIEILRKKEDKYHFDITYLDDNLYSELYAGLREENKDLDQVEISKLLYNRDNSVFDKIRAFEADIWIAPEDTALAFLCAWEIERLDLELSRGHQVACPNIMYGRVKDQNQKPFTLRTLYVPKGKELA